MSKKFKYLVPLAILATSCTALTVREQQVRSPSSLGWSDSEQMDLARMKQVAFASCQKSFKAPSAEPVVVLDPPKAGGHDAVGMVYQEELEIQTTNLLDRDGFYFSPRPRAAVNTLPMEMFVGDSSSGTYQRKTWDDANPNYSSAMIRPMIEKNSLPPAAKVLTELIIGHVSPQGDWPQLFDIRSSAYVRFAGYPPQVTGASLRLGAHKIFGQHSSGTVMEDFPVIRSIFVSLPNKQSARALVHLESELFCAALSIDMTPGSDAEMLVDGYWYTREDFDWKKDPHTGFVAYSSMLFKSEKQTPEVSSDEAHDSDTFRLKFSDGTQQKHTLDISESGLKIVDLTAGFAQAQPVEWILANEDRDPMHYADFKAALGNTNYDLRASYKVEILESSHRTGVSLYVQAPDGEYGDNIVALSTIRQNIKKAKSSDQFVRFKYRTTSFLP